MSRYRYQVITARDAVVFEERLNAAGAHGWRLGDFDIRRTINDGTLYVAVLVCGGA